MKVISLVGARPQFVKEAVINWEFRKQGITEILVHSGQHYDYNMSDIFFKSLDIKSPDYNLNVGSATHGQMTGRILEAFEAIVIKEKPDMVLVYGDTNTTLAGAIASVKLKVPIAHVEAGIRQKPKDMPEEINRVLTDRISNFLFCPSMLSVKNLDCEGIKDGVEFVGDTMYDVYTKMEKLFDTSQALKEYGLEKNGFVLATIHRDFNTDNPEKLSQIIDGLNRLSKEIKVLFPIHPRTKKLATTLGKKMLFDVTDPIGYLQLQALVKSSRLVVTDSGGLQKESYYAGKRGVIVMPDTGWRELTDCGWNILSSPSQIYENTIKAMNERMAYPDNIYGNGDAAAKITKAILQ
ncbi:MAG TPA: UDP-N-acetylglucosamine 2-epimerase (non-hydrolyzing) [Petrotogaceae bacterium]|nr:UDP-N-acetylglucosamine 2-epimerase (non-hydrolyzing) [Petrotogaceae bacterium]HQF33133.1 UDP-N-acetylglucosamine 2-epimerase (non-hydrolyzing) [Petrotogaceae bacterium]